VFAHTIKEISIFVIASQSGNLCQTNNMGICTSIFTYYRYLPHIPGARLYHSTASVWLSVDPLSDKYPSVSSYVYCAGNPVRIFDPNGKELVDNLDKWRFNTTTGRLSWLSDEGGTENQTVEFVHNGKDGKLYYNSTKAVNYNGYIGDMFDFSAINPSADKIISGALSIVSGTLGFVAGATIGVGGGVLTGGVATAAGAAICFASGAEVVKGIRTIADASRQDRIAEQQIVKDICHSVGSFAVGQLTTSAKADKVTNFGMLAASLGLTFSQVKHTLFPDFKEIPDGATIIR